MLSRALWCCLTAMRSSRLPTKKLKALQDKKVRRLARHAYRHVQFYKDRFRSAGLTPNDIRNVGDLRHLPILTKDDVKESFPKMIAAGGNLRRRVMRVSTSGSTGPSLEILRDAKSCDYNFGVKLRSHWMWRIRPWDKAARLITGPEEESPAEGFGHLGTELAQMRKMLVGPWNPRLLVPRQRTLGLRTHLRDIGPALLAFKPDVLGGRPSYLRRLLDWLEEEGQELLVRKIICDSEYLSQGTRQDLAEAYNAEVYDTYGAQEFGGLGSECWEHSGMHLFSDIFVYEFLRDGEPVSPGERSEMVITGLHNEAMPLIRYKLGDIAVPEEDERCGCGSYLPRVRAIEGRESDGLILENGTRISPGLIISHIETVIGLKRYQVVQKGYGNVLIRLASKEASVETMEALSRFLRGLLGDTLIIDTEVGTEDSFRVKYRPVFTQLS